jgi:hypothetical protein
MSTVIPFDLDNQKRCVNISSCVLAKPNQLLSIIICLFKIYLFLIKPEDLFDLSCFGSAKAKLAVTIMTMSSFII